MTVELQPTTPVTPEVARENFTQYTRSSSFTLALGIREIRRLRAMNCFTDDNADANALTRLIEKGLLVTLSDNRVRGTMQLSEAGKLVRQLLVISKHIEPTDVHTNPNDILQILSQAAANFSGDFAGGFILKRVENRTIDGEPHLIIRLNEGLGNYSEWAIPRSAIKRIG